MRSPTFLADSSRPLVADASTVINLIATGCASTIIPSMPNRILVVDVIPGELDTGRARGRKDADRLQELVAAGHLDIVALNDAGWQHFEGLVAGPAVETLDDGEAATIAYALENRGTAVIDENKATRLCGIRFPDLRLVSTVDILLHPKVRAELGEQGVGDAVFAALRGARMRVFPHHHEEVIHLIGQERAAQCLSLPRGLRAAVQNAVRTETEHGALLDAKPSR
jgi:predicted nucleic acid-binding protein